MQMGFDLEERLTATVYRYDDVVAVLRDNVTYSSSSIRDLMAVGDGRLRAGGHGRARAQAARALVSAWPSAPTQPGRTGRTTSSPTVVDGLIDQVVDAGQRRAGPRADLPVPGPGHRQDPRRAAARTPSCSTTGRGRIINVAADPDNGMPASDAMLRLPAPSTSRPAAGSPAPTSSATSSRARWTASSWATRRSSRSSACCCPAGAETTYRAIGQLPVRPAHPPRPARRPARRPVAHGPGRRGGHPLGVAAADHQPAEPRATPRWRGSRSPPDSNVIAHVGSANHDETRWDDAEDVRHPPRAEAADRLRLRAAHVPRHAPGPPGDARWPSTACSTACPNLRLDPDGDDPHIHGERFRSPTSLPVLFG